MSLYEAGEYEQAIAAFEALADYKDSVQKIDECKYGAAVILTNIWRSQTSPWSASNMDAPRITPTEIVEMQRLYRELGTYAAVAREMGRSASSVSRYVQMKDVPRNIRIAVENLSMKESV